MPPSIRLLALIAATLIGLAGCGRPPGADGGATGPPDIPPPGPPTAGPGSLPSGFPPGSPGVPGSPGFGDSFAVDCRGEPDADEVIDVLADSGDVAPDLDLEVTTGPLCAGGWQFSVVTAPDLDPLHVVTEGEPGSLELIVVGTDVCTPEVRIQAPPGIRTAAGCA